MRTPAQIRLLAIAGLSASTLLCAQSRPSSPPETTSTLPSTAPTTTPAAPLTPAQSPPHRADVSYVNGQITVSASNSSLNQILRDIARLTRIKITGGVVDERVFGNYGPEAPNDILGKLLDGTGSNMLLVQATGDQPSELILTPRTGGPTPPNPNAASFNNSSDEDEPPRQLPNPTQQHESQSYPTAPNATPQPITPPPSDNSGNNNNGIPPSSDSNQQQSPGGVKTPQQIFEELQRLRQQQQQQQQPQ